MDYFSKFLRSGAALPPKQTHDYAGEFHKSWTLIKNTLIHPDERQLARGIQSTDVPTHLKSIVDSLVWECTRTEEGVTGACMEYLLKNDVLGTLVRLSEPDRPFGIQVEVLRSVQNMVVLLDEQFLVHSAVHRAVLRLLRTCVGDDIQEQLNGRTTMMGAAGTAIRSTPSEYEEDLVDLLCILCSRIRTYRELLMIFFHDKNWYQSEPLPTLPEDDEEEDYEEDYASAPQQGISHQRTPSPTPSQATVTSASAPASKKPEYEFILFNYLLRFVHREGKIGDFARAGLLFLMDVAMTPGEQVHRLAGDQAPTSSSSSSPSETSHSDPITDAALALAEYILDGDFSEVLGAGLGAVYSLLPSKLEIRPRSPANEVQGNNMVIGGVGPISEEDKEKVEAAREKARAHGLEYSYNPEFKSRLDHFLKLLEFLQDVLRRNVATDNADSHPNTSSLIGSAIVQSILDAVRRIFLENVLYTSILECSDNDGSAVAVMSYIDIMIRTLQDGQLADLLIDFLVCEDDSETVHRRPRSRTTLSLDSTSPFSTSNRDRKLKRRKSSAMMLLEMEAPDAKRQSDYFISLGRFTLKDLLLSNLRSASRPAMAAALQLMQSLLTHHCPVSTDRLFIVMHETRSQGLGSSQLRVSAGDPEEDDDETFVYPGAEAERSPGTDKILSDLGRTLPLAESTYSAHEREMGLYLTLVSSLDPSHNQSAFSTGYDHYVRDALVSLQSHTCYSYDTLFLTQERSKHRLDPNDPILSLILQSLRRFFDNTPELNIALTGVLATIAFCPDRSLAGWLVFGTSDTQSSVGDEENSFPIFEDDGDDRSIDFRIDERLQAQPGPIRTPSDAPAPVVFCILQGLVAQLDRYRSSVTSFDKYLLERRQGLLFSENLTDALSLTFEPSAGVTGSPQTATSVPTDAPETNVQRPKLKPKTSTWSSYLTPKKNRAVPKTAPSLEEPNTQARGGKTVATSPFGHHYQKTNAIAVEPFFAPVPSSGPWTPTERGKSDMDEDVFSSQGQWRDEKLQSTSIYESEEVADVKENRSVTLSQLLDNVVILEECIKELAAIIHARRSLGIDSIRYM